MPTLNWIKNSGEKPESNYYLVYTLNGKVYFEYSESLDWSLNQNNPITYYTQIDQ